MDELLSGAVPEMTDAEVMDVLDPFAGDSQMLKWTSEVNLGQLQVEVIAALGPVQMAVYPPEDASGEVLPVSAADPLVVFVSPASTDLAAMRAVLAAHRPDPYYGLSPDQIQQVQLEAKVRSGADLTMEELQQAVRQLFGV